MIRFFTGRMGCGMGPCFVAEYWWKDRQYVLDSLKELPDKCKECVAENEKEQESK